MSDVKISVGASLDRSVDVTFATLNQRARKFAQTFSGMMAGTTRAGSGAGPAAAAKKATDAVAAVHERAGRRIVETEKGTAQRVLSEWRKTMRDRAREHKQLLDEVAREEKKAADKAVTEARRKMREIERAERQASAADRRARDAFARRTSYQALHYMGGAYNYARRTAGDVLRGAGIDFSLSGGMERARERELAAVGLAQQERIATGSTRGAGFYQKFSMELGGQLKVKPEDVTAMMRKFGARTGEYGKLETLTPKLASLALASGANFEEAGSAAGFLYNQLNKLPDAEERVVGVLRSIIGQTAVGSVEMEDFAKEMGRVVANAPRFQGTVSENATKLAAMAQMVMESGGGTSAAVAARSVAAFGSTLQKGKRIKAFEKHGIDIFTDKSKTQFRDPFQIMQEAILKTKGNIPKLGEMFMEVESRRPVTAMANAFIAGGGLKNEEAGKRAMEAFTKKYMGATLTPEVEKKNVADYQRSKAAQAEVMQQRIDRITAAMSDKLVPAIEKLSPVAERLYESWGKMLVSLAENPGKAIAAAIFLSIARAGIGSLLRVAIDRSTGGVGGIGGAPAVVAAGGVAGKPGARGLGAGALLGSAGVGLAVGLPIAAAIYGAGTQNWSAAEAQRNTVSRELNETHGKGLAQQILNAQTYVQKYKKQHSGWFTRLGDATLGKMVGTGQPGEIAHIEELITRKQAELAEYRKTGKIPDYAGKGGPGAMDPLAIGRGTADALRGTTLTTRIENVDELARAIGTGGPPDVDPSGRGRSGATG